MYCSSRVITIYGFGSHVAASGCCSVSQPHANHCWEFVLVEKCQVCHRNCTDICHTVGNISTSGFVGHVSISRCRSLSQSLGDTLFGLVVVKNPGVAIGMSTLSILVPELQLFPVLAVMSLFLVVAQCHSNMSTLLWELALVENFKFDVGIY